MTFNKFLVLAPIAALAQDPCNATLDVAASANLTIFSSALAKTMENDPDFKNAVETNNLLSTDPQVTDGVPIIFAPTDDAFSYLLNRLNATTVDELASAVGGYNVLATVLLGHVVLDSAETNGISCGDGALDASTCAADKELMWAPCNLKVPVAAGPVETCGGNVLIIDAVLLPESFCEDEPTDMPTTPPSDGPCTSVAAAATNASDTLGIFLNASLAIAGYTGDDCPTCKAFNDNVMPVVTRESSDGPQFAIFAPTNEAFAALLSAADVTDLTELVAKLTAESVAQILMYHVATAAALDENPVDTLKDGSTLTCEPDSSCTDTITAQCGSPVKFQTAVSTCAGNVHVINAVLIPKLGDPATCPLDTNPTATTTQSTDTTQATSSSAIAASAVMAALVAVA